MRVGDRQRVSFGFDWSLIWISGANVAREHLSWNHIWSFPNFIFISFCDRKTLTCRKINWNIFNFFLSCVCQYWNARVCNINEPEFFTLSSSFLKALWDRTSMYEMFSKYRPPWPLYLISLVKQVDNIRRKYRRTCFLSYLY